MSVTQLDRFALQLAFMFQAMRHRLGGANFVVNLATREEVVFTHELLQEVAPDFFRKIRVKCSSKLANLRIKPKIRHDAMLRAKTGIEDMSVFCLDSEWCPGAFPSVWEGLALHLDCFFSSADYVHQHFSLDRFVDSFSNAS